MGLDQRVQVVEQELQLLKAQIQTLLLEIQEQLLNNTYPVLRAKDGGKVAVPEIVAMSKTDPPTLKRVALPEVEVTRNVEPEEEMFELPRSHNGYYHEEEVEQPGQAAAPPPSNLREALLSSQGTDVRVWIELDKWVNEKIKELGIKRTRELINLYGGQERELLMQFVNVYDDAPPQQPQPRQAARPLYPRAEAPAARPTQPTRATVDEQWQKLASATRAKNATYRPFGEHQELVLRLIADMLNSGEEIPTNGNNRYGHAKQ